MDYRDHAKDLLSRKKDLIAAYASITTELQFLEKEKLSCKAMAANAHENDESTKTAYEDRLINILADIEDCRFRKNVVERELLKIEKGMSSLTDYQKDIVNTFFVEQQDHAVDELMERWYKERSSLYRDRTKALDCFTRSVYGVLQL